MVPCVDRLRFCFDGAMRKHGVVFPLSRRLSGRAFAESYPSALTVNGDRLLAGKSLSIGGSALHDRPQDVLNSIRVTYTRLPRILRKQASACPFARRGSPPGRSLLCNTRKLASKESHQGSGTASYFGVDDDGHLVADFRSGITF